MDKRNLPHHVSRFEVKAARDMASRTANARLPQRNTVPRPVATQSPRHICNNPNNPPCSHCGTTIIPSPRATYPLEDRPSITILNWEISTRKRPILNSAELENWEKTQLPGLTLPEMIFGNSHVLIKNTKNDWSLEFNALDALKLVKLEDTGIRVSYSHKWIESKAQQKNQEQLDIEDKSLKIAHHYDWTYTTKYRGTEHSESTKFIKDDSLQLPIDKLARNDKILFFDDMILFEDELADNGISILNVKIRVMNERLLLLSRFFLRVDDVTIKVIDTRVYVEFDENLVMREFKEFEGDYKDILSKHRLSHSHDPKSALRDSNWVAQHTPLVNRECEYIKF